MGWGGGGDKRSVQAFGGGHCPVPPPLDPPLCEHLGGPIEGRPQFCFMQRGPLGPLGSNQVQREAPQKNCLTHRGPLGPLGSNQGTFRREAPPTNQISPPTSSDETNCEKIVVPFFFFTNFARLMGLLRHVFHIPNFQIFSRKQFGS